MKKLGKSGSNRLKAFHIIFFVMWMGGVLGLIAIQLLASPETLEMYYLASKDQLLIDTLLIIPGGIGILITAVLFPILTNKGTLNQRWIKYKWILTILLISIGAGFMGVIVKENASYMEQALLSGIFDPSIYWTNVYSIAIAGIVQLLLFLGVLHLSITKGKPTKKKESA